MCNNYVCFFFCLGMYITTATILVGMCPENIKKLPLYRCIMSLHGVYLLGSEGVHIVSIIRGHQLGDIISLVQGTRNKVNSPH